MDKLQRIARPNLAELSESIDQADRARTAGAGAQRTRADRDEGCRRRERVTVSRARALAASQQPAASTHQSALTSVHRFHPAETPAPQVSERCSPYTEQATRKNSDKYSDFRFFAWKVMNSARNPQIFF